MKTTSALTILTLASLCFSTSQGVAAVTFDWATIGNPGNSPDTEVAQDGTTGYGGVNFAYRISKHEVTNTQYTVFLNAVAEVDANGLYVGSDTDTHAGISRSGSAGSYTYAVKPDSIGNGPGGTDYSYGDKPAVYVTFFNAMRFVNWLDNGQPNGLQDATSTEDGVYAIGSGVNEVRDPSATFFIPTEDEWYKAAYHKNDGVTGNYWDYPTSTDAQPNNNLPSVDTGNSANFFDTSNTTGNGSYPLTDAGAYTQSVSPYGTLDQSGNVFEWTETVIASSTRVLRGGSWFGLGNQMAASFRISNNPSSTFFSTGFRVASIADVVLGGDFDGDGDVDAADYTVWRDALGSADELALNGNGDGIGGVDAADYVLWKQNFGEVASGSLTTATVPEPSSLLMGFAFGMATLWRVR